MLTVWAIDPSQVRRGMLEVIGCTAVMRDMGVDTFHVQIDMGSVLADRITLGWSLVIDDDTARVSGPITKIETTVEAQANTLNLYGVGELHRLKDRLVYPNPKLSASKQDRARYNHKAPAGLVISTLADVSAAASALPSRQSPGFIADRVSMGATVPISERFSNVLEVCRSVGMYGGVTFSAVREEDNTIPLRLRKPQDLSRQVRVVPETGGASTGSLAVEAATVTAAIVAGQGEGAERYIDEVVATDATRRIEVLKDRRDTDDIEAVAQAALDLLSGGAESGKSTLKITETPERIFGRDFKLGDIITVQLGSIQVAKPVRVVEITWDGFGRQIEVSVGDHEDSEDKTPGWVKEVKNLDSRLRGVEAQ